MFKKSLDRFEELHARDAEADQHRAEPLTDAEVDELDDLHKIIISESEFGSLDAYDLALRARFAATEK